MTQHHTKHFPNESDTYREKRNLLLTEEIKLRKQLEDIAALRRQLPLGGELKENYIFTEGPTDLNQNGPIIETAFSDLFTEDKNNLLVYSFMFPPDADSPCPACTSLIDGLNGLAPHIRSKINFVAIAKAPIEKFRSWALKRNWHNQRLLSSFHNTYNKAYFGEDEQGNQEPAINVFTKNEQGIFHFYNTELLYAPTEEGQHPRHADQFWPIWNLYDLTPEGRDGWFPRYQYD